ncbi:unnamed protein product [Schistocephalus solidus]|uniref:FCH domain-containing protein n=1 Tax=Schistocephalus solidus TaxID=70667 RepID=A0A183TG49_SCHSO|nr:unnamed protein product [Schistocephalus solidus]
MSAEEGLLHFFSFRKKRWPDDFVTSPSSSRKHSSPVFFSRPSSPTNSPVACDDCRFAAADTALAFHISRTPLVCTHRVLTELRTQFTEQSKCLDAKLDVDSTVLAELQEFYRRRAIVEQDYSDALAKLANSLKHKHLAETGNNLLLMPVGFLAIINMEYLSYPAFPVSSIALEQFGNVTQYLPRFYRSIQLKGSPQICLRQSQRPITQQLARPNWTNYTTTSLWNTLLGSTLRLSQAHSTLSEVYSKQMIQRLIDMDEDAFRLHRQVCTPQLSSL